MSLLLRSIRAASAMAMTSNSAASRSFFTAQTPWVASLKRSDVLKRWLFKSMGYNKYGLYHDDLYNDDEYGEAHVVEAVKRLPPQLLDERNYRIQRAMQLEVLKTKLPKEEWISYEENWDKGYYLEPYIEEVLKEMEEEEKWFKRAK